MRVGVGVFGLLSSLALGFGQTTAALAQAEPQFGTRSVHVCSKQTSLPSPAQAAALLQCNAEVKEATNITLWENVRVEIGGAQPYNFNAHSRLTGVDTAAKVYPIRGSYLYWNCDTISSYNRGANCHSVDFRNATGYCWPTTFGDWQCAMSGTGDPAKSNLPPPS